MVKYTLTYFDGRGRAEVSRLIFAAAGVKYNDVRITFEQWPALKTSGRCPFGTLPLLEFDGKSLGQSYAIARFLANETGLAGKSNSDKARVDMIAYAFKDLGDEMANFAFESDEAKKTELTKKFVTETAPKTLSDVAKLLEANNDGKGFFVGKEVTWADLAFLEATYTLAAFKDAKLLDAHPKLVALKQRVAALPKIKKWLETRPETPF